MFYDEMQEKIENTWRITPEFVRENQGIVSFCGTNVVLP
jgi:hypothetical protein